MPSYASVIAQNIIRGSNYVNGHGSYIDDYRDKDGGIWERMLQISHPTMVHLLSEAIAGNTPNPDDHFGFLDTYSDPSISERWMCVANKDVVFFQANHKYIYGIYNHDCRYYIVRAEGKRLLAYLDGRGWRDTVPLNILYQLYGK